MLPNMEIYSVINMYVFIYTQEIYTCIFLDMYIAQNLRIRFKESDMQ
jgi:hypothetical protein